MADFTGTDEIDWILAPSGIGDLCGARVWETSVPDGVALYRDGDSGEVWPYIVCTFNTPFPLASGKPLAGGNEETPYEQTLMHKLTFMIVSYGSNPDEARRVMRSIRKRLVGRHPSPTAGAIGGSGGFINAEKDAQSRPTRYAAAAWFTVDINLSGATT